MNLPSLDTAAIGWPITRLGVSFFPVYLSTNGLPAIATGEESGLVVDELDEPSVQALRVRNPGDKPVLVVEGEHFLGGKQDRALNATVLVPALADLDIPVSCLEQGRWGRRRAWNRNAAFAAAPLRATKNAGVAESMRRCASRDGNQTAVWRKVDDLLSRRSVHSSTAAAADVKQAAHLQEPSRVAVVEKLVACGPLPGQCGIIVVQGHWVMAMDLFGAPHLLAAHWGALIRSYLLESPVAKGSPSAARVLKIVRSCASAQAAQETAGVGLGVEHRVADEGLTGHALTLNGAIVHAAFFIGAPRKKRVGTKARQQVRRSRNDELTGRARGLMAGSAAGNLLGRMMEGWPREQIAMRFPDGVREITAPAGFPDDDDVAQTIVIAEAAEEGPLDVDDLGRRFWEWAETNGTGMGELTGAVLALYGGDYPRRLAVSRRRGSARPPTGVPITDASRAAWDGWRAGNGAAMRCGPIAIRWYGDTAALVRNSVLSAVPTHWDRRCGWSCALLSLAAAAALRGESMTEEELLEAGLNGVRASLPALGRYGYEARVPESVQATVRQAYEVDIDNLDALDIEGESMGYTLLALQVGLVAYWRASSFEQDLRRVIEAGGDTDTNGAVAGALLGARLGIEGMPQRWRSQVSEIRSEHSPMEAYADRLLAARREGGSREPAGSG